MPRQLQMVGILEPVHMISWIYCFDSEVLCDKRRGKMADGVLYTPKTVIGFMKRLPC